jgi:hypothetical protein
VAAQYLADLPRYVVGDVGAPGEEQRQEAQTVDAVAHRLVGHVEQGRLGELHIDETHPSRADLFLQIRGHLLERLPPAWILLWTYRYLLPGSGLGLPFCIDSVSMYIDFIYTERSTIGSE